MDKTHRRLVCGVIAIFMVVITLTLYACSTTTPTAALVPTQAAPASPTLTEPPPSQPTAELPTLTAELPSPTAGPTTAPPPTELPALEALPPEPQEIVFQAADGQEHRGTYYPSVDNPAPLVVLMHWARGDQTDWVEIAYWLQNRGLGGQTPAGSDPWLDPSWFPPMLEGRSFAVFTFSFRTCESGCQSFEPEGWLLDAQAAMGTAMNLDGVDPNRIAAVGASIGSDGSPDGCFWLNDQHENSCLGALSLSPGSYLTVPYQEAVKALEVEQPPKPVWCLYAEGDVDSAEACRSAAGDHYRVFNYEGRLHGMELIQPDVEPNALQLILEFLRLSFGL